MLNDGQKISFEYSVFLEDGTPIDSNVGEEPLTVVLGKHQVFPALEDALRSCTVGEPKQIHLPAHEAYGPVVPEAFREVDLSAIPESFRFEGAVLGVQDPAGGVFPIRVHKVEGEKAVLDFNHPLAGKDLRFDLKVLRAGGG